MAQADISSDYMTQGSNHHLPSGVASKEGKIVRVPCELERRFMDVLHVILSDAWELPSGKKWIQILDYLNAFDISSQMCSQDNPLRDCYHFFKKASQLFDFEKVFNERIVENNGVYMGSVEVQQTNA